MADNLIKIDANSNICDSRVAINKNFMVLSKKLTNIDDIVSHNVDKKIDSLLNDKDFLNKLSKKFADVAITGSYNDLNDKPKIIYDDEKSIVLLSEEKIKELIDDKIAKAVDNFIGKYFGFELSADIQTISQYVDSRIYDISRNYKYKSIYNGAAEPVNEDTISDKSNLVSVEINSIVTSIPDGEFKDCINLNKVTFGTYIQNIGVNAFDGCDNLTDIHFGGTKGQWGSKNYDNDNNLPKNLVYVHCYDGDIILKRCIAKYDNDDKLYYEEFIPDDKRANLVAVEIVDGVTEIAGFMNCEKLTSVNIPESVTTIGKDAFAGCTSLTSIDIPNTVANIGNASFYGCTSLTSIDIPNSVTYIGYSAFAGCVSLTSVTITTSVETIRENAFGVTDDSIGCENLKEITYFGTKEDWNSITLSEYGDDWKSKELQFVHCVNDNSYIFFNNYKLTYRDEDGNEEIVYADSVDNDNRQNLVYAEILPNVQTIMNSAFANCSGLMSVTIPNSVTSIGESAFDGCYNLTSITIPNSVETIGRYAFESCTNLTSVSIGNSVTSIEGSAFINCTGLTSITIPNSVTNIEYAAFAYCTGLTTVTIPNSVTNIGNETFCGCSGLESIVVESGNINYDSRENCNAIIETTSNTLIAGCKNTIIPNTVTIIGFGAFEDCSSLTSITIPESVTIIEARAFGGCSGLTSITCLRTTPPELGSDNDYGLSNLQNVYVPADSLDAYKEATNWSFYGDKMHRYFDKTQSI